ncbi:FAD-binding protein [Rhizobium rhizogenes]|jgi:D-lactate dehydrogenase (cytochrome)|uniref:FAD-binding oxidoreductase n=1 Tax=Rhizobium rhizogenes TaxID=359 RepID=UPI003ED02AAB
MTAMIGHSGPQSDLADTAIAKLKLHFGDRLTTAAAVRDQHGRDVSWHPSYPPDAVVFPETADEVSRIVATCHALDVPVIPFGTGTSCEGHVAALMGGICIDLSRLDRILMVQPEDMTATVEAGVTRKRLNAELRDTGLFFPVDPGADASLGGMASTRASGTNAMRYGTMKDNVISLGVVLPNGDRIRTASHARKSAAGYDLTRLWVGSEGTLGIVTDVTVKLHPIPDHVVAISASFATLEQAVGFVLVATRLTDTLARIELLDELQVEAVNSYSKLSLPVEPTLFIELHGSRGAVEAALPFIEEEAHAAGASRFDTAVSAEARGKLWQARHDIWWANLALRPGASALPTDSCVPISRLVEAILAAKADVRDLGLLAPICGHVGDGNFHLCVLFDPTDLDERQRVEVLTKRLSARAIALEGTSTGEHGIGHGKIAALVAEHGPAIRVMAAIKRAIDPHNIMNPGKIFNLAEAPPFN